MCVIKFPVYFPLFLSASFYGDSFVELNMAEASLQTSLQLQFRTSKPQGLLLLAAGKTDYCLMELRSGYVQVCFITVAKKRMCSLYCSEFFLRLLSMARYLNKFLFKEMEKSHNIIDNFKVWLLFLKIVVKSL